VGTAGAAILLRRLPRPRPVLLLLAAAIRLSRELVTVAGLASLAWGVPHLIYHLFERDGLSTSDQFVSLAGLFAFVVFAGIVTATGWGLRTVQVEVP